MTLHLRPFVLLASLWLAGGVAAAAGLQVSPVSLTLAANQTAEGLWLSNTENTPVNAQVRVFRWTQEGGEDKLTPTRGLVISPPMLQLAGGDRQLIRAIRLGAPPSGPNAAQEAYRMIIDELPADTTGKKGVQFVLRYSVPVFVEPAGAPAAPAQLSWTIRREGDKAVLEVANTGGTAAQLASLTFTDAAGHRTELTPGLLGYVLPGAQMRWALKPAAKVFASGGTLETLINGQTVQQNIALVDAPR